MSSVLLTPGGLHAPLATRRRTMLDIVPRRARSPPVATALNGAPSEWSASERNMAGLTPWHLLLLLVIVLLVLGPGKLPETGEAIGKAIRSFREAAEGPKASDGPAVGGRNDTQPPAA